MSGAEPGFWEHPEQVERFAGRDPDLRLAALLEESPGSSAWRVLDLGCAGGRNTLLLAERGCDVVALDASAAMAARTRDRLAAILGRREADRRVRQSRMDDLAWAESGAFDLVVAVGIYHCAQGRGEWLRALGESRRVLRPGGRLLVSAFTPKTDLTGRGVRAVPGEPFVYEGFPGGGRSVLMDARSLDAELERLGFEPEVETRTVTRRLEIGRRVTVNGLYRKLEPNPTA